jgi:hypothetical protein
MATWAFRMCLLRRRVSAEVCGDLAGGAGLPHGEKYLCGRMLQGGVSEYSVGASVCESCAWIRACYADGDLQENV